MLTRRTTNLLTVGVFSIAAGVAGFFAGSTTAPSDSDAQRAKTTALTTARSQSQAVAAKAAQARGERIGRRDGTDAGRRAGARLGRRQAATRIERERTRAAEAAARIPSLNDTPLGADAPDPVDGECPPPFSYHMGICKLARPARPEECPPGYAPAGLTGACAPATPEGYRDFEEQYGSP